MEKIKLEITKETFEEIIDALTSINCLECGGVDNWEGYGECWDDEDEIKEDIIKTYNSYIVE